MHLEHASVCGLARLSWRQLMSPVPVGCECVLMETYALLTLYRRNDRSAIDKKETFTRHN